VISTTVPQAGATAGFRILVVDDNVDSAESLAMLLSLGSHDTRVAHSGAEALTAVDDFSPEVVFLDIGMPGMNGYEVARELRKRTELQETVLIALTGWGREDDVKLSRDAGFHEHLMKPVDFDAIETLLSRLKSATASR
jgi:CheY-like chemotaxis protein